MAVLAVQKVSQAGLAPAFTAAAGGGDSFVNDGNTMLHVKNGGGGSVTVTVDSVRKCDFGFDHDATVAVPAAGERMIGPFPVARFGRNVSITYTGVTSVTVAAIEAA